MMKIISGSCKGMAIHAPKGLTTRPSSARVREAVMSLLGDRISGASFLDLYAGSGSMGLEALSRGASQICFVEQDKHALTAIRDNVKEARRRLSKQGLSYCEPVISATSVPKVIAEGRLFFKADIIWADPPYSIQEQVLDLDFASHLKKFSSDQAMFCLESDVKTSHALQELWDSSPDWRLAKAKKYGNTMIAVWIRQGESK